MPYFVILLLLASIADPLSDLLELHAELRSTLGDRGLGVVYRLLYYVLDPRVFLLCIGPVLMLERLRPARERPPTFWTSFWFDWSYPIFAIGIASFIVSPAVLAVHRTYAAIWPAHLSGFVSGLPGVVQYVIAFLVQDFLRFAFHYGRHRVPWLWHFHSIHHSQVNMNVATTHRAHPLEAITGALLFALPIGLIGTDPVPWIYAGLTGLFWDFFIHSNVRTNLGLIGKAVASPQYHRIHHSALPEHVDRNFGERLLVWDILFRTRCDDRDSYPPTGCAESSVLMEDPDQRLWVLRSWGKQAMYPIRRIGTEALLRDQRNLT